MWRPAHGATSRPGPSRPASGYGRAPGRPGPHSDDAPGGDHVEGMLDPIAFGELVVQVRRPGRDVEQESEAPAPVTP